MDLVLFCRMGRELVRGMNDVSDNINEQQSVQVKDDEIYAAMNAVLFSVDHLESSSKFGALKEPPVAHSSNRDEQLVDFHLNSEHQGDSSNLSNSDTSNETAVTLVGNIKRTRKSMAIKNKEELDRCLEAQKLKRRNEKILRNSTETKAKRKGRDLLKVPDQCLDCGKVFAYTGYLESHMR